MLTNTKRILGCLVIIVIAISFAIWRAWCAGRWHGTLIGAEVEGLFVGVLVTSFWLFFIVDDNHWLGILGCHSVVVAFIITFFCLAPKVMFHAYVVGFENIIFKVAPVDRWQSIVTPAEQWLANPSGKEWNLAMLPAFVRDAYYPGDWGWSRVIADPKLHDVTVQVVWAGGEFDTGLEIGKQGAMKGEYYREIYRTKYNDCVSVVLFGGK